MENLQMWIFYWVRHGKLTESINSMNEKRIQRAICNYNLS
jgi:hypothetical protein